ncbi:plastocyanin/azurin family copper-binding protein [Fibrella sp. WM1]|uniref:plastocyanin/azurin family copper-binding protein n=1 Tax=Fibrella musci TaxID=3242485 RepID=UPI003522E3D8
MRIRLLLLLSLLAMGGVATAQAVRDTTILIKTMAGLQFSEKRLVLRPQTRLTLIVENDDDMAHNLVVTKPNSRARVVEFALALGDAGPARQFVPALSDVLAHTRLLSPGDSDTLTLTLPDEGDFSYVCTYPGHGSIMYGMLYVTSSPRRLPPIERDPNLPQTEAHMGHPHTAGPPAEHPYTLRLPAVYRTFMPDASPAAIAVGLPGLSGGPQQSYCWDATTCQLRYAWAGGFVDNTEQWDGKGQRLTKLVGDLFFRDSTTHTPWYVGGQPAQVRFGGYALLNRYPEFTYTASGVTIRELTKPQAGQRGLVRRFTIGPTRQELRLRLGDAANQYKTSAGRIERGWLIIPPTVRSVTLSSVVLPTAQLP